jgi:hypothetical protein
VADCAADGPERPQAMTGEKPALTIAVRIEVEGDLVIAADLTGSESEVDRLYDWIGAHPAAEELFEALLKLRRELRERGALP